MLVGKPGVISAEGKREKNISKNVQFLRVHFILSHSGKIKVLTRKQNFSLFFFLMLPHSISWSKRLERERFVATRKRSGWS